MEKLLREGILKITISSPTLTQGLNLAATAFTPNILPDDWREMIEAWLKGEALREHDFNSDGMTIDDFEVGLIVPAVENGSLNRCAAMFMQAGFSSRLEAINSIRSTEAAFSNSRGFKEWLSSDRLTAYISLLDLNTAKLW